MNVWFRIFFIAFAYLVITDGNYAFVSRQSRIPLKAARVCQYEKLNAVRLANFTFTPKIILDPDTSRIKLLQVIRWDTFVPEGVVLDGYVYTMENFDRVTADVHTPVCNASGEYFWMNTTSTNCSRNASLCVDAARPSELFPPGYRLCPVSYYPEEPPFHCSGTGERFITESFISIPKTIQELSFEIDFYRGYVLNIYPYYQQYVHIASPLASNDYNVQTAPPVSDCPKVLSESIGIGIVEAADLCCDQNISHFIVRNVTFSNLKVDFDHETVNITVTWLPPIDTDNFRTFGVHVFGSDFGDEFPEKSDITVHQLSEEERKKLPRCDDTTVYYKIKFSKLTPLTKILPLFRTYYTDDSPESLSCVADNCAVTVPFLVPAVNVCDHHYCSKVSNCTPDDVTGKETFNATCKCHAGYEGNGINSTLNLLGTGCKDKSFCTPDLDPCANHAFCIDRPAPQLGADCECLSGYYGDGLTECYSSITLGFSIVAPIIVILFCAFSLLGWRYYRAKQMKNDLMWSQFVSNDTLRTYTMINNLSFDNDDNACLPTFGEKWEIDREKMRLENILGRGNYGVVYQGYLAQESGEGKLIEIPVAVKTVKEGAEETRHLAEFLAEIGFMLNIESHPNVLGVIGCCTTQKPVYLITDYLKYGDLLHFLWDAREPTKCLDDPVYHLTEKSLYLIGRQVAEGMDYLTKSRIIHGDIAARNILVGENLNCKISDFGLANDVYRYGVIQGQSERCVPLKWISPERMMAGKVPITSKSDVWSFGILMYEMVTLGCMPHADVRSDQLLEKLKSGYRMKQPSTCSDEMYSIMSKCWKWKPFSRPSFVDLTKLIDEASGVEKKINYINLADAVQEINKMMYEDEIEGEKEKHALAHKVEERNNEDLVFKSKDLPKNGDYVNITFDNRI